MSGKVSLGDEKIQSGESVEDLIEAVKFFCEERDWDQFHGFKELAIGVVTEGSELLELFRFRTPDEVEAMTKEPRERERIQDEVADVFFFLLRMAGRYEINLAEALRSKLKKNALKYPVEKARGTNRKYDEL